MTITADVTPENYWDTYEEWKTACKEKLVENGYLTKNRIELLGYAFRTLITGFITVPGIIILASLLIAGLSYPQGTSGLMIDIWTAEAAISTIAETNQIMLIAWLISGTIITGLLTIIRPWVSPLDKRLSELMASWIADHLDQNPGIANKHNNGNRLETSRVDWQLLRP